MMHGDVGCSLLFLGSPHLLSFNHELLKKKIIIIIKKLQQHMFWGPLTLSETDAIYWWMVCNGFFILILDPEVICVAPLMLCPLCLKIRGRGGRDETMTQLHIFFITVT